MHDSVVLDSSVVHTELISDSIWELVLLLLILKKNSIDIMVDNNQTLKELATPDDLHPYNPEIDKTFHRLCRSNRSRSAVMHDSVVHIELIFDSISEPVFLGKFGSECFGLFLFCFCLVQGEKVVGTQILVGNQRERTTSSRGFLSFLICL